MNGTICRAWVEQCLAPTLRPGDVGVRDNLGAHKGESIRTLIAACGAELRYLPPYSPELQPAEKVWTGDR